MLHLLPLVGDKTRNVKHAHQNCNNSRPSHKLSKDALEDYDLRTVCISCGKYNYWVVYYTQDERVCKNLLSNDVLPADLMIASNVVVWANAANDWSGENQFLDCNTAGAMYEDSHRFCTGLESCSMIYCSASYFAVDVVEHSLFWYALDLPHKNLHNPPLTTSTHYSWWHYGSAYHGSARRELLGFVTFDFETDKGTGTKIFHIFWKLLSVGCWSKRYQKI